MEPVEVLRRLGGAATRAQITRYSTRWALEKAVERGEIEQTRRGKYALPGLTSALTVAAALDGEVSHASAAQHWLLESLCPPSAVHVTVPRWAHRQAGKSVVLHYGELDGERVTPPLRTVLDCARTLPWREALAIADSALRRDVVTAQELRAAADALRGPGSRMARRVAVRADARAANPFESALRATVLDAGEEGFVPQLLVPETGYWVDLGDPKRKIALEADSFAYHGSPAALERDCRRYDELVRAGWLLLRFSWEQVMFDEAWVTTMVVDTGRLRNGRAGRGPGRLSGALRPGSRGARAADGRRRGAGPE